MDLRDRTPDMRWPRIGAEEAGALLLGLVLAALAAAVLLTMFLPERPPLPGFARWPDVERGWAVAALLGFSFGALAAGVLSMLRPFSRRRESPRQAAAMLAALIALSAIGGRYGGPDGPLLAVAAACAAAGGLLHWAADRPRAAADADERGLLPDREIRAAIEGAKPDGDRWVLVTGAARSGKTALVEQLHDAAVSGDAFPLHAPTRRSVEDAGVRVTEINPIDRRGGAARLWLWESRAFEGLPGRLPALRRFDGVVLAVDPVRAAPVAATFPPGLADGEGPVDVDQQVLRLADAIGAGGGAGPRGVWAVITKADLIRFSVAEALLAFPVRSGPDWRAQMSSLHVDFAEPARRGQTRRELARCLGLDCLDREHRPAFRWGTDSPYLAHSPGRSRAGREPFGGANLLRNIRDAVL